MNEHKEGNEEEAVVPLICPFSMYSGRPTSCVGISCPLWVEVKREIETESGILIEAGFDCLYKLHLSFSFQRWNWEKEKGDRKADEKT